MPAGLILSGIKTFRGLRTVGARLENCPGRGKTGGVTHSTFRPLSFGQSSLKRLEPGSPEVLSIPGGVNWEEYLCHSRLRCSWPLPLWPSLCLSTGMGTASTTVLRCPRRWGRCIYEPLGTACSGAWSSSIRFRSMLADVPWLGRRQGTPPGVVHAVARAENSPRKKTGGVMHSTLRPLSFG
jgi:hypothetical protein